MSDTHRQPRQQRRGPYAKRMKPLVQQAGGDARMCADQIKPGAFHHGQGYVPKGEHDKTQFTKSSPVKKEALRNGRRAYQKRGRRALEKQMHEEADDAKS